MLSCMLLAQVQVTFEKEEHLVVLKQEPFTK